MRGSEPPRAAEWLLQHLVPGSMNDALAGDLAEEFARRGAAWYWRQVLLAIGAGWAQRIRAEWLSIGFSFAWVFIGGEWLARMNLRLFAWMAHRPTWVGLPWPWSLVVEIAAYSLQGLSPLCAGLVLYLAIARRCTWREGMLGLATLLVGFTAWTAVVTFLVGNHLHPPLLFPLGDTFVLLLAIVMGSHVRTRKGQAIAPRSSGPLG